MTAGSESDVIILRHVICRYICCFRRQGRTPYCAGPVLTPERSSVSSGRHLSACDESRRNLLLTYLRFSMSSQLRILSKRGSSSEQPARRVFMTCLPVRVTCKVLWVRRGGSLLGRCCMLWAVEVQRRDTVGLRYGVRGQSISMGDVDRPSRGQKTREDVCRSVTMRRCHNRTQQTEHKAALHPRNI